MENKKVAFITLGCKVNQYETNAMCEKFINKGYEVVEKEEKADIYIVNTCTVTNMSDRKSRQMLRRVKEINEKAIIVAGKNIENRVRVILDIEGYKEKREKTLEDLAEKVAKTVIKTRKSVTLEPMQPYERKIIHSKLQDNDKVETKSIGEEPRRRIVISLKK